VAPYPGDHQQSERRLRVAIVALAAVAAVTGAVVAGRHAARPDARSSFVAGQVSPAAAETPGPPAPPAPPAPPGSRERPAAAARITLAFAGDVHFAGRVRGLLDDPASAFGPVAAVLSRADLAMVNLETAITERGAAEPKQYTFRAPASAFEALRAAGVDVATMANNHGVDYGPVGLADSLAAIRAARFPVVGLGADAGRAYAPWLGTVGGHRVAILGASQVRDRTLSAWTAGPDSPGIASAYSPRLVAAVRAARAVAEIVVVYLHWGVEGQECPSGDQRAVAAALAAAGADAVIGTHAHLLLGGGFLGPAYVAYGLGNFLWWRDAAFSNDTGVLTLTFRGRRVESARLVPARIDPAGRPVPTTGGESARVLAKWDRVRGCAGLSDNPR
jgi:poly-gamma-glutamate capsule biosynthesis protein CapA/YwtB (metallophosphatase superfamily)